MERSGEVYVLDSRPSNLLAAPMHTIRIFIMGGGGGGEGANENSTLPDRQPQ